MSRFKRLSHVIWCCKYHIVWVPKYRFRILKGPIAEELYKTIHVYCGRMGCEVIELNILGKPFLGQRLLCGYGWPQRRTHT